MKTLSILTVTYLLFSNFVAHAQQTSETQCENLASKSISSSTFTCPGEIKDPRMEGTLPDGSPYQADEGIVEKCGKKGITLKIDRNGCFSADTEEKKKEKEGLGFGTVTETNGKVKTTVTKNEKGTFALPDYKELPRHQMLSVEQCIAQKKLKIVKDEYEKTTNNQQKFLNDSQKNIDEINEEIKKTDLLLSKIKTYLQTLKNIGDQTQKNNKAKEIQNSEKYNFSAQKEETFGSEYEAFLNQKQQNIEKEKKICDETLSKLSENKRKRLKEIDECLGSCLSQIDSDLQSMTMRLLGEKTSHFDVGKYMSVGDEHRFSFFDPPKNSGQKSILDKAIRLMIQTMGTLGVLLFIIGGIVMITANGDDNKLQKGKNILFYTSVGIVIAFLSYIIVQFIISLLFSFG